MQVPKPVNGCVLRILQSKVYQSLSYQFNLHGSKKFNSIQPSWLHFRFFDLKSYFYTYEQHVVAAAVVAAVVVAVSTVVAVVAVVAVVGPAVVSAVILTAGPAVVLQ